MRQRAIDRGLRLSEFGLIPEAKAGDLKGMAAAHLSLPAVDESEIYRHLDLGLGPLRTARRYRRNFCCKQ